MQPWKSYPAVIAGINMTKTLLALGTRRSTMWPHLRTADETTQVLIILSVRDLLECGSLEVSVLELLHPLVLRSIARTSASG